MTGNSELSSLLFYKELDDERKRDDMNIHDVSSSVHEESRCQKNSVRCDISNLSLKPSVKVPSIQSPE